MTAGKVVTWEAGIGLEEEGGAVSGKVVGDRNEINDTSAGAACVAVPGVTARGDVGGWGLVTMGVGTCIRTMDGTASLSEIEAVDYGVQGNQVFDLRVVDVGHSGVCRGMCWGAYLADVPIVL